jgi:hypothetical protein
MVTPFLGEEATYSPKMLCSLVSKQKEHASPFFNGTFKRLICLDAVVFDHIGPNTYLPVHASAACTPRQPLACKILAWVWMAKTWMAQIGFTRTAAS